MATNNLPKQHDQLLTLAEDASDGATAHESSIGLAQNLGVNIQADLDVLRAAQNDHLQMRTAKTATTAAQTIADSNGKAFIASAKGVLANFLGASWSAAWLPVGFVGNSLAVPSTIGERQELLRSLANYFTANQGNQNIPLNVTQARALALFNALSAARSAAHDASTNAGVQRAARDAAAELLRRRLRGLIDELGQLLEDDDPRWYAFGLNAPADPATPGIPDGLVLTAGPAGSGICYTDCADARRAERYVWEIKPAGSTDWTQSGDSTTESDATLTGLPVGVVKVRVKARNTAGDSAPSAEATVTLA